MSTAEGVKAIEKKVSSQVYSSQASLVDRTVNAFPSFASSLSLPSRA